VKVIAIKHVPHEPMGYIEDLLSDMGIEYEYITRGKSRKFEMQLT